MLINNNVSSVENYNYFCSQKMIHLGSVSFKSVLFRLRPKDHIFCSPILGSNLGPQRGFGAYGLLFFTLFKETIVTDVIVKLSTGHSLELPGKNVSMKHYLDQVGLWGLTGLP